MLSGLTRVRQFSQDDAHCFITEDQIGEEVERLLGLIGRVYGDFGLDYRIELSTRPDDHLGDIETWNHAEDPAQGRVDGPRDAVRDFRRRRKLLRTKDRRARHRRNRTTVAVCDHPARLHDAAALQPEVHRVR